MATFPLLKPSAAPVAPGAWPVSAIGSLNGAESRIRQGSAEIGRRLRLTFTNITESEFLALLAHYRGQRSGFDSFGFDTTTLAADRTPAGFAWLYASRPQVVDEHLDCFTVQCEFKAEPRGLVVAPGRAWQSAQTSLTRNVAPGKAWSTSSTTFTPGTGARFAAGVQWATEATRFTRDSVGRAAAWATSTTTLTPGSRAVYNDSGTPYTVTGGSSMAWSLGLYGWTFTLYTTKTIKGVGFYDIDQNGLTDSYGIGIGTLDSDGLQEYEQLAFDAAGDWPYIIIPSGTTAGLSGPWRRVDLQSGVAGATLAAGNYLIYAFPYTSSSADSLLKSASNLVIATGAAFGQNLASSNGFYNTTNSADGIAYFGPMIFFE
jgi:hypothetical protein